MFTNRWFVLIVALALLTVGALTIQAGVATSAVVNANPSLSDYVRDLNGAIAPAPYVSRSDMLRDRAITAEPYVSRSDYVSDPSDYPAPAPYLSRSDFLRSLGH